MIDSLKGLAIKFQGFKLLVNFLLMTSLITFLFITFSDYAIASDDTYLIPSFSLLIWSLLACSFLYTFPFVPNIPGKEVNFFKRFKIRLLRVYYYLISFIALIASLAVLIMSFRFIGIWIRKVIELQKT